METLGKSSTRKFFKAKQNFYLKCTFHAFGFAVIVTSVLNQLLIFLYILRHGIIFLCEPNILILSAEIIMYIFGLIYSVWSYKNKLKEFRTTKNG